MVSHRASVKHCISDGGDPLADRSKRPQHGDNHQDHTQRELAVKRLELTAAGVVPAHAPRERALNPWWLSARSFLSVSKFLLFS